MSATINVDKIKDKAEKLHALAVRGVAGEMANAKRKLTSLVNKHPEILGGKYADYLNAENASYAKQNEPKKDKEDLFRKYTEDMFCISHPTFCDFYLVHLICEEMGLKPIGADGMMMLGNCRGYISIFDTYEIIGELRYKFHIRKDKFREQFDKITM